MHLPKKSKTYNHYSIMTTSNSNKNGGVWRLIVIALIVAAIAVGVIYYIGWFDNRTHVDAPDGDNVEETYELPDETSPAAVEWQNADGQSLDEVIADPEAETATPPTAE